MTRVCFDSRPASGPRGIGRYARSLLAGLRIEAARNGGQIVEGRQPRRADDVFHAPWLDGALLRPRVPQVVTVHDLVHFKRPGQALRAGLRGRMRRLAVERTARLIAPTRVVADEAAALLRYDRERIHVIPEAPARAFTPRPREEVEAVRRRHGVPEDYLLWVGCLRRPDPHRRVHALVDAPRQLPLVMAGEPGQWARELHGVILTGEVDDDELAALYTGARALLMASDDEGFGLQAVEALACGAPVVACDVPALREVLGDRARFVDCDDLHALMEAGAAGKRPAPRPPEWTWEDAAAATWGVYEEAVAG